LHKKTLTCIAATTTTTATTELATFATTVTASIYVKLCRDIEAAAARATKLIAATYTANGAHNQTPWVVVH